MSRRERLLTLLELARRRADEEARTVAGNRQALEVSRQRLEALQAFRGDYDAQAREDTGRSLAALALKTRRQLVAHLDAALAEADRSVEHARRRVAVAEERWRERRTHSGALEKAMDRLDTDARRRRERAEQRRLDEHVSFALAPRTRAR